MQRRRSEVAPGPAGHEAREEDDRMADTDQARLEALLIAEECAHRAVREAQHAHTNTGMNLAEARMKEESAHRAYVAHLELMAATKRPRRTRRRT